MTKILKKNRNKKELPRHDESTYENPTSNTTDNKSLVLPQGCEHTRRSFMPPLVPASLQVLAKANGTQNRDGSDLRGERNNKEGSLI